MVAWDIVDVFVNHVKSYCIGVAVSFKRPSLFIAVVALGEGWAASYSLSGQSSSGTRAGFEGKGHFTEGVCR